MTPRSTYYTVSADEIGISTDVRSLSRHVGRSKAAPEAWAGHRHCLMVSNRGQGTRRTVPLWHGEREEGGDYRRPSNSIFAETRTNPGVVPDGQYPVDLSGPALKIGSSSGHNDRRLFLTFVALWPPHRQNKSTARDKCVKSSDLARRSHLEFGTASVRGASGIFRSRNGSLLSPMQLNHSSPIVIDLQGEEIGIGSKIRRDTGI